jgi:hypothetical protein
MISFLPAKAEHATVGCNRSSRTTHAPARPETDMGFPSRHGSSLFFLADRNLRSSRGNRGLLLVWQAWAATNDIHRTLNRKPHTVVMAKVSFVSGSIAALGEVAGGFGE